MVDAEVAPMMHFCAFFDSHVHQYFCVWVSDCFFLWVPCVYCRGQRCYNMLALRLIPIAMIRRAGAHALACTGVS